LHFENYSPHFEVFVHFLTPGKNILQKIALIMFIPSMFNHITENQRLKSMKRYLDLNFERDSHLKDIAFLASQVMGTPVSLITLMDKDVQWIITPHGIDLKQMPRATSFCTHAIEESGIMVVNDASTDIRFKEAPLVVHQPNVRFYAGVPLRSEDGFNIGTLCVLDDQPRYPDQNQLDCLSALTRQVINIMDLNLSLHTIKDNYTAIEQQHLALQKIAFLQSHHLRAPLCNALGVADIIRSEGLDEDGTHFSILENALQEMDRRIHEIVRETEAGMSDKGGMQNPEFTT
jgi:GAF domain